MSLPLHTPAAIPTTLIIDFYDSYTRNLLSLFSRLGALCEAGKDGQSIWQAEDWSSRVVVVNVDSLTWFGTSDRIFPSPNSLTIDAVGINSSRRFYHISTASFSDPDQARRTRLPISPGRRDSFASLVIRYRYWESAWDIKDWRLHSVEQCVEVSSRIERESMLMILGLGWESARSSTWTGFASATRWI